MTITTDAYAQTNTERLANVEDNTNSIIAALSGIADAITAGFAEVMAALGAIQTGVNAIDSEVGTIHGEVESLGADVAATQAGLEDVSDKIDAVNAGIAAAATALNQPDPAVAAIAEGVTANSVAINSLADQLAEVNSMLEMISEEVGAVEEAVATSSDGTTTALSELHAVEVEYGVPVSAFGLNKATDTVYKADLKLTCESLVFVDKVTTDIGTEASADSAPFEPEAVPPVVATASVVANGMTVYDTKFRTGPSTTVLYSDGATFNLAELTAGSSLTIKLSTNRVAIPIESDTSAAANVNKTFSIQAYLAANARDRVTSATGTETADGGTNQTKAEAGKVTVFTLTTDVYSPVEDPKCTVTPPAGPTVDYAQTDQEVSFAISAPATETRSIKTIDNAVFTCSGATAITKVTLEGGLIADFRSFVDLTISADTTTSLNFENPADTDILEAVLEEPLEITSGDVTISGKIPGSAALVSVTYDTVANAKCSTN